MLKIRLQRVGRRNQPHFRLVVTEHTNGPKSNRFVDIVGFKNLQTKEQKVDADKVKAWIAKGAKPSDTVHNLLVKAGIIKGETINVLPQKSPVVKEVEETAEEAPAAESADEAAEKPADAEDASEVEEEASAEEKKES